MTKLTIRFTIYFTIGLLIFLVYLVIMSAALIKLFDPIYVQKVIYTVDSPITLVKHILIILFCFVTGGLLFSVFLVYPLVYIMNAIRNLSQGSFAYTTTKAFRKNDRVKWPYFLYKEIIMNINNVARILEKDQHDRKQLDKSKTEWIAGVSHDLKTPLSYVTGYSSLIMNKNHHWEIQDIMPYIEEIYGKGMYIENLIEDLNMTFFMDGVDRSQLKLKQVDLVAFLQNIMVDIVNEKRSQAYDFEFKSEFDELKTIIDEKLMYRAIFNLLTNAIEHNSEETEIALSLLMRNGKIHIDITDNGVGMEESTIQNVFDRYYSKKEEAKLHKGLGLCIVKQIIEAHEAQIFVDSAFGKGTTFHIIFPSEMSESQGMCKRPN